MGIRYIKAFFFLMSDKEKVTIWSQKYEFEFWPY